MTVHSDIINSCHPQYDATFEEMEKFRLVMAGGDAFINRYLQQFAKKESNDDFALRKSLTYNPAFASSVISEIKNNIFSRMVDITRIGGSTSYTSGIAGEGGGVDANGSSMNSFVGQHIIEELMSMSRVGILVDRPILSENATLKETNASKPYLYAYRTECIKHWFVDSSGILVEILLEDKFPEFFTNSNLIKTTKKQFRHMVLTSQGVIVSRFNEDGIEIGEPTTLKLKKIPFVIGELSNSLLRNIANYQIALLNLSSSAMFYTQHSNFIFYIEQMKQSARANDVKNNGKAITNAPVGTISGRGYLEDLDAPSFISPPSEPAEVNLKMQEQLKREIKDLVNVNLASLGSDRGLESGLSYIGLELERIEGEVATIWSDYENSDKISKITYPTNYSLKSDTERFAEAEKLSDIRKTVPSLTYRKELSKDIAKITLLDKVPAETMDKIFKEIDTARTIIANPEVLLDAHTAGVISDALTAEGLSLPPEDIEQAKKDRIERLEQTMKAQIKFGRKGLDNNAQDNLGARGIDSSPESKQDAKGEKKVNKIIADEGK